MALSKRKSVFGIHQITPYDINTRLPLGTAKVIGAASVTPSGENVELVGGSSPYPWEVETGALTLDLSITLREFPDWIYDVLLAKPATVNTAEALGSVSALTNTFGTSVLNAATGIASIAVKAGSEADLKTSAYVVKAASATTVDIFALSDAEFSNGNPLAYVDDSLKINAAPLTITGTSGETDIPNAGLTLTGGSGVVAMTAGDTAIFSVRSKNAGSLTAKIGGQNDTFREVGLFITAQRKGSKELFTIDVFKAKGTGVPFALTEKAFAESELVMKAAYCQGRDGVFEVSRIDQ